MVIYDNRGRLVSWTASIHSTNGTDILVKIIPLMNLQTFDVLTPREPAELLEGETLFVDIFTNITCDLSLNLKSYNGNFINETINQLPVGYSRVPIMDIGENYPDTGNLIGAIGCDNLNLREFDLKWHKVGHRIISSNFYSLVDYDKTSIISLSPIYEGNGQRYYNIEIQGAASRIAEIENAGSLTSDDNLLITINPEGLLVPGMIARGEIVLVDNFGIELRIPIVLEAKSSFNNNSAFSWLSEPGNGLFLVSILLAVSVFTGGSGSNRRAESESMEK